MVERGRRKMDDMTVLHSHKGFFITRFAVIIEVAGYREAWAL